MPKEKQAKANKEKLLSVDNLRHAEYYEMQKVFDDLYARSLKGEKFTDLVGIILSRENILLAYRNIKTNDGSKTPGTDNTTIKDIGKLGPDEVVEKVRVIVMGSKYGYRPKPVRRKEIPKPNGSTRPLGIPCIWDRLVQQCIKQVMEPICEAKFSENSFGFRPNRSVENAMAVTYKHLQQSGLRFVCEFDVKGFFDNVDHAKLMRQVWAMGIHDTHLIYILRKILTAPIRMPDGKTVVPQKGTPQGGIISPLLANIVLNELDHWIESQWEENPVVYKYSTGKNKNGSLSKSSGYRAMRKTNLKEMHIVRYADDFRIFCKTKSEAERTKIAVTQWLSDRLKLEVSPEKTRVVNTKRHWAEFLGFKFKLHKKGKKQVVMARMCDKAKKRTRDKLCEQAKRIAKPRKKYGEVGEINLYNSMVTGTQNYYGIATHINLDASDLNRAVMTILTNRLGTEKKSRLRKKERKGKKRKRNPRLLESGRELTKFEKERFGKSDMLRYVAGSGEPIYPIGYTQCKNPMSKKRSVCSYTPEGRQGLHDNLRINVKLLAQLMRQPVYGQSTEYADNRLSLFSSQWGKCAATGREFQSTDEIHCHHKIPRAKGGTDAYENLTLVSDQVHRLIHTTQAVTIRGYLSLLNLDANQLSKVNDLREKAGNSKIEVNIQKEGQTNDNSPMRLYKRKN